MLESNPSRNSQLETHPKGEPRRRPLVGASIVRIDFLMPLKLIKRRRREAAPLYFAVSAERFFFACAAVKVRKKYHLNGRGCIFSRVPIVQAVPFRPVFSGRSGSGAFAIGLAIDDELMSAMAEPIQSALSQHRFIEDGHPFLDASIRRENRGTAGVPFDQQIVEVGGRLA